MKSGLGIHSLLQFKFFTSVENGLSKPSYEQIIEELAGFYGIEPEYTDTWGRVHRTSLGNKLNILKGLGVGVDTEAQAVEAWHARQESQWSYMTDPSIVASLSNPPSELVFQIPCKGQGALAGPATVNLEASLEVTDEHGKVQRYAFTSDDLVLCETKRVEDRVYEFWSLPFPQLQTLGYYRFHLSVDAGGRQWSQSVCVAICPDKSYIPPALQDGGRVAGVAISLYGVRSKRNWGIGDLGDLKEILTWAAEDLQASIIGLNPLHGTFNRRPFNTSPYLPTSRFYRNFIYLDIPAVEDYQDSPEARNLVSASHTQRLLSEVRASETVQYEEVADLKHRVLMQVFLTFLRNHWNKGDHKSGRGKELQQYIEKEGLLLDNYATFCAIDSAVRSSHPEAWTWPQWPLEYQRPDTEAVRQFQKEHWQEVLFYKFVQWQLEKQLDEVQDHARSLGMCIGLYHDLALAVDRFSADFWAYQDLFTSKLRMGAPPDEFSQYGQDWGFPLPNMEKLRKTGYDLFVREIQKNCAFAGALRIDHVMRFFHLYCIPEGEPPSDGAYVSQPVQDLLKIVTLESVRNQVVIVGEDLGTVPAYMRDILAEANVFSYRLLYFEKDDQQNFILPQDYPELAVVTVTTHDLPTLAGFWTHRDIGLREGAGMFDNQQAVVKASDEREADKEKLLALLQDLSLLPGHGSRNASAYPEVTGEIHNAVVTFLAMTPAKLFILSQEDLFKEADQQNLPGTTVEHPNWSIKMRYTVEQLRTDPKAKSFCEMFRGVISKSGRNRRTLTVS
ncbi:MAG: 4-alpha-glucanotransferase [Deltaproteobacteria bacterium]|nr:4-alpha-glucanotransferase [Deltaproteobacteria bacterium]